MEEATNLIRVTAIGLTLAAGAAFPAAASAHATLLSTSPEVGAVVRKAPRSVLITFDQEVRPVSGGSQVIDAGGNPVTDGSAHTSQTDVKTLVIPLKPDLPKGDYTVRWEIVATDGHLESGVFAFGVGTGRPPPQAASFSGSDQDWRYLLARTAYFAGLLALIGGVVYRVLVFAPVLESEPAEARPMMSLRERHRANQVLAASAVLTLAGGWVALTIQGADVAGVSFWEAFDHRGPVASALDATRFGREFGRGIDVTAAFTVVVALAYAAAPHGRRIALGLLGIPAAALGIWALAVPGLSGHAGDPGGGLLQVTVDAAHVAAAAIWAGGLLQLAWVTPHATRGLPDAQRTAARTAIARRFSAIALGCVIVVALTGLIRALNEFSSVAEVWTTSYGQTLIVKSLLLAALVALGYRNRHILTQFPRLRRSVTIELGLMTALVAAVALLTNLPPGKLSVGSATAAGSVPAPAGGPARIRFQGNSTLAIWPGTAGTNALALELAGGTNTADALLELPDGSTRTVTLQRTAPGEYSGFAEDLPAGTISATVGSGSKTLGAKLEIGKASVVPGAAPAPEQQGSLAAAEAADLAVGAQRTGGGQARITVLAPDGSAPRNVLVRIRGRTALPCLRTAAVCYTATVPRGAVALPVSVERPDGKLVSARLDLPAADAPSAAAIVRRSRTALLDKRSMVIDNVLASDPSHSVTTRFVVQAPDRLSIDVVDGAQARIIGNQRWDRTQNTGWTKQKTDPLKLPDPYWVAGQKGAHVVSTTPTEMVVTLAQYTDVPVFYRLLIDRRTGLVTELHMTTAAHFMQERYRDFDNAPPVTPPPA
jgi:copper transport protein